MDITTKRIINIDESWLDYSEYQRRSWQVIGQNNSVRCRAVIPRIAIIVALDTNGEMWISMHQVNNNS